MDKDMQDMWPSTDIWKNVTQNNYIYFETCTYMYNVLQLYYIVTVIIYLHDRDPSNWQDALNTH